MAQPKLLLADDSVTIRKVVELTFADEGIDVSSAADAESAMQKFVEVQPDIVLVDIGLPGTTGYQICEMIKQDDATNHIPVLLLVGSFEPFDQDEAERVGADGFLTKPFHSIRDLVARVWDLLGSPANASAPTEEVADIEELYQNSFSDTAEIEEFDTVDDLLGDASMDDEMIEATYPASNGDSLPSDEAGKEVKEFEWSPESLIQETMSAALTVPFIETSSAFDAPADEEVSKDEAEPAEVVTDADRTAVEDPDEKDFDWSPESSVGEAAPEPIAAAGLNVAYADFGVPVVAKEIPEESEAEESSEAEPEAVAKSAVAEPAEAIYSPELIEAVAQRVIDRLSDQAVREIAREAVPRIAEKLIREALDADGKE